MESMRGLGHEHPERAQAERWIWIALIITSGACLTPFFACVTPFAALATLAALKLDRRDMFVVLGSVWLANQAIGYGILGYPWTWDSAAWGLAIGASVGLALLAAAGLSITRPAPLAVSLPFVAAFVTFELGLHAAGYLLPGSEGAFSAWVIGRVFLINVGAVCGLTAAYHLAMLARRFARHDATVSVPIEGASLR